MFRSGAISLKRENWGSQVSSSWERFPSRLLDEMGHMLDRYQLWPFGKEQRQGSFIPSVEVIENDKSIHIDAELPGVDVQDIDVTLTGNTLIIKGEKKEEFEHGKEDVCCSERHYGTFWREIGLPCDVDMSMAEAFYGNGVLCINLPKVEGTMSRKKVPIRSVETISH